MQKHLGVSSNCDHFPRVRNHKVYPDLVMPYLIKQIQASDEVKMPVSIARIFPSDGSM